VTTLPEWIDISHEYEYPERTRMSASVAGLRLGVGQYVSRHWHWWVLDATGRALATDKAPSREEAMQQANDFVFHYPNEG